MPAALREQGGQEGGVAAHHGEEIGADDLLPCLHRDVLGATHREETDVVHHDIDPPEPFEDHVTGSVEVALLRYVERERGPLGTAPGPLCRDGGGALGVNVSDRNMRTGTRQGEVLFPDRCRYPRQ